MPERTRRWLPRLALVAIGVAIALAVAEIAIRLVRPQLVLVVDPGLYASAPEPLRYRLQPGFRGHITNRREFDHAVSIDALGLRGTEVAAAKDPGRLRILALGDSFTFGVGVEDDQPWVARLASRLAAAGVPAEGLNAGAPGYGVPDEDRWLEVYGDQLDPDLVLLGVFPGNDLHDAAPGGPKMEVVGGELRRTGERNDVKRWLYYHSHLFAFLKSGLPLGAQTRVRSMLGLDEPYETQLRRLELALYDPQSSLLVEAGLAETGAALERLRDRCARLGAPLVVIVIPALPEVDDQAWQELVRTSGERKPRLDRHRPTRLIAELGARLELPVLDLGPALTAAHQRGERVYFPIDRHLTAAGHELVAVEIADFLQRNALLAGVEL